MVSKGKLKIQIHDVKLQFSVDKCTNQRHFECIFSAANSLFHSTELEVAPHWSGSIALPSRVARHSQILQLTVPTSATTKTKRKWRRAQTYLYYYLSYRSVLNNLSCNLTSSAQLNFELPCKHATYSSTHTHTHPPTQFLWWIAACSSGDWKKKEKKRMLKIAAEGIAPRLAACCLITSSAQSSCQRVAPQAARATQKYLSQSQMHYKKLVIKDHYEFDQKVRSKFHTHTHAHAT